MKWLIDAIDLDHYDLKSSMGEGVAMDTKVVTAHVPLDLADKVDVLASRLDRSRGWIVKQALADWVALEEQHHLMTLDALADVDAGRTIDNATFQAWLDSLDTSMPLPTPLV